MYDPWVTREMTVRDLLVHRSGLGLGAGDLLFVPRSDLSREETVRRLRHIKPATSFRSGYAYDNVLYMVAGQLIEEVTGQTWEQFMPRARVRAGRHDRLDRRRRRAASPTANRARPHARLDGAIRGLGDQVPLDEARSSSAAMPRPPAASRSAPTTWRAGSPSSSRHGAAARRQPRCSARRSRAEMWNPVVLQPIAPAPPELCSAAQPMFSTYALGWDVQDYRGARLVWHGGAVFGSLAAVALLPDQNVGFSIAANREEGELVRGLMYELLDHYLGLPRDSWPEKLHALQGGARRPRRSTALQAPAAQPARVGPSLPLARYAGDYADPWYGTITIREDERPARRSTSRTTPGMTATLEH